MNKDFDLIDNTIISLPKDAENDRIEVEIGDAKQDEFLPQIKIKRWDNEVNCSFRLVTEGNESSYVLDGDKIEYLENGIKRTAFYPLEKDDHLFEDGGHEFEVWLSQRPKFPEVKFSIQSKGLVFFKQLPLTDEEIKNGDTRPENVINSFAVYHESKQGNFVGGNNYGPGKVFQIPRAWIMDANGVREWLDMDIELDGDGNGFLTIPLPEKFLDNAAYPVLIDPTFGYTSVGASSTGINSRAYAVQFTSPSDFGTLSDMSAYIYQFYSSRNDELGIYSDNGSNAPSTRRDKIAANSYQSTAYWFTASGFSYSGAASTLYWLAMATAGLCDIYFDSGSNLVYRNTGVTALPDPFGGSSNTARQYSIYATYTAAGGGGTDASVNATGVEMQLAAPATTPKVDASVTATGVQAQLAAATTSPQSSSSLSVNGVALQLAAPTVTITATASVNATGVAIELAAPATTPRVDASVSATGVSTELSAATSSPQSSSSLAISGVEVQLSAPSVTLESDSTLAVSGVQIEIAAPVTTPTTPGNATVSATGVTIELTAPSVSPQSSSSLDISGVEIEIGTAITSFNGSATVTVTGVEIVFATAAVTPQASSNISVSGVQIEVQAPATTPQVAASVNATAPSIEIGAPSITPSISKSLAVNGVGILISTASVDLSAGSEIAVTGVQLELATATVTATTRSFVPGLAGPVADLYGRELRIDLKGEKIIFDLEQRQQRLTLR